MFNLAAIQAPLSGGFAYPYSLNNSAMFDSLSTTYIAAATGGTFNSYKGTFSAWVKRTWLGLDQCLFSGRVSDNNEARIWFNTSDQLTFRNEYSGVEEGIFTSDGVFQDCSGWYHIVVTWDTTAGSSDNALQVYVNGVQIGITWTDTLPSNTPVNLFRWDSATAIGRSVQGDTYYFNGYMADVNLLDNIHVANADGFGQTKNGIWCPKSYTGSYGTMGSRYLFGTAAALGTDTSGNGNDGTSTNMGTDHQSGDTPTNNHVTWDANNKTSNLGGLVEGGLTPYATASNWVGLGATKMAFSGKWYFEHTIGADNAYISVGVACRPQTLGSVLTSNLDYGWSYYAYALQLMANGGSYYKIISNAATLLADLGSYTSGDVLQVAFDVDTGKVWLGLNNTWTGSGDPGAGTNETVDFSADVDSGALAQGMLPVCSFHSASASGKTNFGQETFAYTPPTGFTGFAPENFTVPEGLLLAPNNGFEAIEYDGTGAIQSITGVGFQPDLVWIKNQDALDSHQLFDSVRGAGFPMIVDDGTPVEAENADTLTSFDADGFSLGADDVVNTSGEKYSAWCLKKGAAYGFDIQTYTGNGSAGKTVAHDLGVEPHMIWCWNRTDGENIWVYHRMTGNTLGATHNTAYLRLDTNAANAASAGAWNNTDPTDSIVTLGSATNVNGSGDSMVMFLFASIPGFSKCFHYYANANANGVMVHCGFKPRFILVKNKSRAASWIVYDTVFNDVAYATGYGFYPDTNATLANINTFRVTAQGFKVYSTGTYANAANGEVFLGIAFADLPNNLATAF